MNEATKQCHTCHYVKPLVAYHRSDSTDDGRADTCKACKNREGVRRHRARHGTERDKQQHKAYQLATRRLREKYRAEFDRLYAAAKREVDES